PSGPVHARAAARREPGERPPRRDTERGRQATHRPRRPAVAQSRGRDGGRRAGARRGDQGTPARAGPSQAPRAATVTEVATTMSMTTDAKHALATTIRSLRARLIEDFHAATEMAYRLSVHSRDAGLDEAARARRGRLEAWIAEQVRAQGATGIRGKRS